MRLQAIRIAKRESKPEQSDTGKGKVEYYLKTRNCQLNDSDWEGNSDKGDFIEARVRTRPVIHPNHNVQRRLTYKEAVDRGLVHEENDIPPLGPIEIGTNTEV